MCVLVIYFICVCVCLNTAAASSIPAVAQAGIAIASLVGAGSSVASLGLQAQQYEDYLAQREDQFALLKEQRQLIQHQLRQFKDQDVINRAERERYFRERAIEAARHLNRVPIMRSAAASVTPYRTFQSPVNTNVSWVMTRSMTRVGAGMAPPSQPRVMETSFMSSAPTSSRSTSGSISFRDLAPSPPPRPPPPSFHIGAARILQQQTPAARAGLSWTGRMRNLWQRYAPVRTRGTGQEMMPLLRRGGGGGSPTEIEELGGGGNIRGPTTWRQRAGQWVRAHKRPLLIAGGVLGGLAAVGGAIGGGLAAASKKRRKQLKEEQQQIIDTGMTTSPYGSGEPIAGDTLAGRNQIVYGGGGAGGSGGGGGGGYFPASFYERSGVKRRRMRRKKRKTTKHKQLKRKGKKSKRKSIKRLKKKRPIKHRKKKTFKRHHKKTFKRHKFPAF